MTFRLKLKKRPCHFWQPFVKSDGYIYPCCKIWGNSNLRIGHLQDPDIIERFIQYDQQCQCEGYQLCKAEPAEIHTIKLLNIEKSLVSFTSSLKSNELMMEKLQNGKIIKINLEDKDFLEDVIIDNRQAIEMSNIYSNILSGMMDAFASVISNNLNVVLKFLTSVTIILMIPTLVASIYGMNVELPFQHSPQAFGIAMVISLVFSIIGVMIFMKRRWF